MYYVAYNVIAAKDKWISTTINGGCPTEDIKSECSNIIGKSNKTCSLACENGSAGRVCDIMTKRRLIGVMVGKELSTPTASEGEGSLRTTKYASGQATLCLRTKCFHSVGQCNRSSSLLYVPSIQYKFLGPKTEKLWTVYQVFMKGHYQRVTKVNKEAKRICSLESLERYFIANGNTKQTNMS